MRIIIYSGSPCCKSGWLKSMVEVHNTKSEVGLSLLIPNPFYCLVISLAMFKHPKYPQDTATVPHTKQLSPFALIVPTSSFVRKGEKKKHASYSDKHAHFD